MELTDMAKAHLANVEAALRDLFAQREKIEQEINKMSNYLKEGEALILSQQASNVESTVDGE